MDTLQIPMTKSMKVFLEKQATRKGFVSPTEYVQSLLTELQQQECARAELEEKLLEGMRSPSVEVNEVFWRELKEEFLREHPEVK